MKITKFGQSCLLLEEAGIKILTDPGSFSTNQNFVKNISIILITHSHPDHLSVESLKEIIKNNPDAKVFTNKSVGEILSKEEIKYNVLENGQSVNENGIEIQAIGSDHGIIYPTLPKAQNTGYLISNKLFFPGDALTELNKSVDILTVPVIGPFLKISEAIDYALKVRPKYVIPIHDGLVKIPGGAHKIMGTILGQNNIKFIFLEIDKEIEL